MDESLLGPWNTYQREQEGHVGEEEEEEEVAKKNEGKQRKEEREERGKLKMQQRLF